MTSARIPRTRYRAEADPADADQQTLLCWYPAVTAAPDDYIRSAVKIEAGAKSALDPNVLTDVRPYAAEDLPDFDLQITGITTVEPQRTFWDKVVILHGLRTWFDRRGQLRHEGQRVSRHYYDVFRMLQSPIGEAVVTDLALAVDCARHARMFFNSPDFDLDHALPGTLSLAPSPAMLEPLERDYDAMAGMIMGAVHHSPRSLRPFRHLRNASTNVTECLEERPFALSDHNVLASVPQWHAPRKLSPLFRSAQHATRCPHLFADITGARPERTVTRQFPHESSVACL